MDEIFIARGASAHQLNALADWVRETVAKTIDGTVDIIRFVEVDLPQIFPDLYVHIEDDDTMREKRAFVTKDGRGIVVSESIYDGASNGCQYSSEIILHEVGHLFLHHKHRALGLNNADAFYRQRIKNTNLANSAEWQASVFATCFLYPYEELRKFSSPSDIHLRFKVSLKQADRIFRHFGRLRARECSRDRKAESTWLKQVVEDLPFHRCDEERQRPVPEQLSFFDRPAAWEKVAPRA